MFQFKFSVHFVTCNLCSHFLSQGNHFLRLIKKKKKQVGRIIEDQTVKVNRENQLETMTFLISNLMLDF